MKIAIHPSNNSFSQYWIEYCNKKGIPWKQVDCYRNDIIAQMEDCDALMWHFSQNDPKAIIFARQMIYSVEMTGKKVFPDFYTVWHFDDKVGQKYLLESVGAPMPPTWVFYDKMEALDWVRSTNFPKVFKLRGGAASQNVKLVRNKRTAVKMVRRAFGRGFPAYDPLGSLKERWRKYRLRESPLQDLVEGMARFVLPPPYSRVRGNEKGYIYFQEFIPGNDHDIRVVVIGDRAISVKRLVRKNDFRASGSGDMQYKKELFDPELIRLAFKISEALRTQIVSMDFLYKGNSPLLVEISYGFPVGKHIDIIPGYWDRELKWHEENFKPYDWMMEDLLKGLKD